jgi:hypothetical protein
LAGKSLGGCNGLPRYLLQLLFRGSDNPQKVHPTFAGRRVLATGGSQLNELEGQSGAQSRDGVLLIHPLHQTVGQSDDLGGAAAGFIQEHHLRTGLAKGAKQPRLGAGKGAHDALVGIPHPHQLPGAC